MQEGWFNDEYLILYSAEESAVLAASYGFAHSLPGFTLIGLRFWDNFIAVDAAGRMCSLPTVPLKPAMAESFSLPGDLALKPDARFTGKIKWYVKPLAVGGDPGDEGNLTWLDQQQHAQLVSWWNEKIAGL